MAQSMVMMETRCTICSSRNYKSIAGLKDISWSFATLWWADNYEIHDEAKPVYIFGGNDYPLRGGITGLYYPRTNGSKVLTFGFDLSLTLTFQLKNKP
ncbi:MAG: hypothetical protein IPL08_11500 [Saprospiraceae bacterium]|nr:hypothetical protein [Saprospiraceae bacterium]